MASPTQQTGARAEALAESFLRSLGYRIIGRHATSRYGEIDLIALAGSELVFVEVRYRLDESYGTIEETFSAAKQNRLAAAIADWLQAHPEYEESDYRLDIIAVSGRDRLNLRHHRAVELPAVAD